MRVAVTGGTGFVGRRVVARLTAAGHETVAISRRAGHPIDAGPDALARAFEGWEAVVLRAGLPEPGGFEVADSRCAPETPPW